MDDDDIYDDYDGPENECWHEEFDVEFLIGRARCRLCDHRWYLTAEQLDRYSKSQP